MTVEEYVRKAFESRVSSIILKQKLKESDCNWALEAEWDTYEQKLSEMYQTVTAWREARKPIPFWRHWIIGSTISNDEEIVDDYPGGEAKEFLIWYFSAMLKECSEETFKFVIGDDDVTR